MDGIVNRYGFVKKGRGVVQEDHIEDTYGFELFDWDLCEDKRVKSSVCRRTIPMVESEMTCDTCMWDTKPKKPQRRDKKNSKKQQQQQKKNRNNGGGGEDKSNILIRSLREAYQKITKEVGDSKVCQYDDYTLFGEDIFNLQHDEWLSDSNISFFYSMIKNGFLKDMKSVVLLPPTFSFLLGNHYDPISLKEVMPQELSDSQIVFCAVNDNIDFDDAQGGSHWSLLICLRELGVCLGVDSMRGGNENEMRKLTEQFGLMFNRQLNYKEINGSPQQINGSDCGVIVLAITMIYINRILNLESNEIVNWELDNVRVNALSCRLWMMESLKVLSI